LALVEALLDVLGGEKAMTRFSTFIASVIAIIGFTATSQATLIQYVAVLNGPSESPPVASPGTGNATVDYDDVAHTLALHVDFVGLVGTTTVSHIHAPTAVPLAGTAGVATTTPTFAGFPAGVTSGSFTNTLNLTLASSWNPAFVTANGGTTAGAEAALASAMASGRAYWNIHSTFAPSGEIRGFLVPVPEPGTLSLLALGALVAIRRRR
jgi:CHRD domain-containing protein/PEP-CTERM motif-containing protein